MISIDKLKSITHLVTHGPSCPDGIASALIIKDALPHVRVSFMSYDTAEVAALKVEPGLLFVDFTPPRERVAEFVVAGSVCLDHHPTAKDIVEAFGENGAFGLNEKAESGAWLAYEHVWAPTYVAEGGSLDDYVSMDVKNFAWRGGVRDTWKTSHPDWQRAMQDASLCMFWKMSQPLTYYTDESEYEKSARDLLGKRLAENMLEAAQRSLDESFRFTSRYGTNVLMFQGVTPTSDAAELCEKLSFEVHLVVGFHYKVDAGKLQLKFSMRSHTGFDCAAFAKYHGGGGHKAAAGFTIDEVAGSINPYAVFSVLLEQWEGR